MSVRELVVLGTASQVPTRERAHHGALLRWDDEGILLDPGEGNPEAAHPVELARDVDLLVCESTYLTAEEQLAASYAHLTAAQAAGIAVKAGARRLVLTHYSQRHADEAVYADEARALFPDVPDVHAARDLDRIALPPRRA
jgi:ribonuclease BN (tRNA processing enzyme)